MDLTKTDSLVQKKLKIEREIEQLQTKLDEPNKKYQLYAGALKAWEKQRSDIVGNSTAVGTVIYYQEQIKSLDTVPQKLTDSRLRRLAKAKEIHSVIRQLADTYRELYAPVNQFIEKRPLAKERFHLNFEVGIVDTGFEESFLILLLME